jgi:HAMP domain-containing protein
MPLFDLFWTMLMLFLWLAWIWVVIAVVMDIFRSDDLGGAAKALWTLFVIILPWLGVLAYLIARGQGMATRSMARAAEQEQAAQTYIREVASTSVADELAKLSELKSSGVINEQEFNAQKARLLA